MPKPRDRIIIDTNLWISFLLNNDFSKLDVPLANKSCELLFSQELLDEFLEVAKRPKFQKYFNSETLQKLTDYIDLYAEFVEVNSEITLCRDPKDNFLLSLALDGKATHLITGDKDLLEIKVFENTKIVTISSYLSKFKAIKFINPCSNLSKLPMVPTPFSTLKLARIIILNMVLYRRAGMYF